MTRPRISNYRRRLWKANPLARLGIPYSQAEQDIICALLTAGHVAQAQQRILDHIKREIDGPRTVRRRRGGRFVLQAVT